MKTSVEAKDCPICGEEKVKEQYSKRKWGNPKGPCMSCVDWQVKQQIANAKAKAAHDRAVVVDPSVRGPTSSPSDAAISVSSSPMAIDLDDPCDRIAMEVESVGSGTIGAADMSDDEQQPSDTNAGSNGRGANSGDSSSSQKRGRSRRQSRQRRLFKSRRTFPPNRHVKPDAHDELEFERDGPSSKLPHSKPKAQAQAQIVRKNRTELMGRAKRFTNEGEGREETSGSDLNVAGSESDDDESSSESDVESASGVSIGRKALFWHYLTDNSLAPFVGVIHKIVRARGKVEIKFPEGKKKEEWYSTKEARRGVQRYKAFQEGDRRPGLTDVPDYKSHPLIEATSDIDFSTSGLDDFSSSDDAAYLSRSDDSAVDCSSDDDYDDCRYDDDDDEEELLMQESQSGVSTRTGGTVPRSRTSNSAPKPSHVPVFESYRGENESFNADNIGDDHLFLYRTNNFQRNGKALPPAWNTDNMTRKEYVERNINEMFAIQRGELQIYSFSDLHASKHLSLPSSGLDRIEEDHPSIPLVRLGNSKDHRGDDFNVINERTLRCKDAHVPSDAPSSDPSSQPSSDPSSQPSAVPSDAPSNVPNEPILDRLSKQYSKIEKCLLESGALNDKELFEIDVSRNALIAHFGISGVANAWERTPYGPAPGLLKSTEYVGTKYPELGRLLGELIVIETHDFQQALGIDMFVMNETRRDCIKKVASALGCPDLAQKMLAPGCSIGIMKELVSDRTLHLYSRHLTMRQSILMASICFFQCSCLSPSTLIPKMASEKATIDFAFR